MELATSLLGGGSTVLKMIDYFYLENAWHMGEKSAANPSRLPLLFTCISLPVLDLPTSQYSNRKEVVSFLIRTPSNSVPFNPCVATTDNEELTHPELATFCAANGPHVPCWELVLGLQPPYLGSSHSVSKLLCFNITDELSAVFGQITAIGQPSPLFN